MKLEELRKISNLGKNIDSLESADLFIGTVCDHFPTLLDVVDAAGKLLDKAIVSDLIPNNSDTRIWLTPLREALKKLESIE